MITVVGLGPGSKDALTIGVLEILKSNKNIYFRTEKHPNVKYLESMGVKFNTYDNFYEEYNNFDHIYKAIAEDLIKIYQQEGDLVYAVPGHPLVAEKSVTILLELCKENGIEARLMPSVSFVDAVIESLRIDPIEGVKLIDAFDIGEKVMDKGLE